MPQEHRTLDELLRAAAEADGDAYFTLGLAELVASIRPRNPRDTESPSRALQALCHILNNQPGLRGDFRRALIRFLASRKAVSFYADAGMFPNRGFFAETMRRISRSLLPDDANTAYLKDVISVIFDRSSDAHWVSAIPDEHWRDLLVALRLDEGDPTPQAITLVEEICEALQIISYRIAAIGLEPELLRVAPALEKLELPFLAQNPEMLRYLADYRAWLRGNGPATDGMRLGVLLDQGHSLVETVRTQASRNGTSLSLTLFLSRIGQHLNRCQALLAVLENFARRRSFEDAASSLVLLIKHLIVAECRKNDTGEFWRANIDILARRVTDNASRTGEHYITSERNDYLAMLRSAALGGAIIAFMALAKIFILDAHLPPLTEALAVCLNYGIGFVIIHILHGTVATKQPAMTAATIAASIEGSDPQSNLDHLAALIARTARSQFVAILGNVSVALPMAIAIGTGLTWALGHPYPLPEKAQPLIAASHPWLSGSVVFAAIAGVCLFLAGLISGYYDNLSAYNRIPQRLVALKLPNRILGKERWERITRYIENNLGALAGNFFLGFLLGGMTAFGALFGLPVDIRHVTFSAAITGYSINALGFALPWQEVAVTAAGIVLIGFVNLVVSFSLSLRVACRARQLTVPLTALLGSVLDLFRRRPQEFFLPPRREREKAPIADTAEG